MKNLMTIPLILLLVLSISTSAQKSDCEQFENTDEKLKNWTYQGKQLKIIPFKEAASVLEMVNDEQVNDLLQGVKTNRNIGMVFSIVGAVGMGAGAGLVNFDITTGLIVAAPGFACMMVGLVLSKAAESKFKKSILRYNKVCEMNLGMASQGLGAGLYLTF